MVTFSHLDEGTPENVWAETLATRGLPLLDLDIETLIVVAAHPDDETLGAGGLIHTAATRGIRLHVVVLTDGERSHPHSPTHSPPALARRRRGEVRMAMEALGARASEQFTGLGDGRLDRARDAVDEAIDRAVCAAGFAPRTLVIAPWAGDGHRDHRIAGEVAEDVADRRGARFGGYPIWLWHWGAAPDVPWSRAEVLPLTPGARAAKQRALAAHASQTERLSPATGDEAMLTPGMLAHFTRDIEIFIAPSAAARRHRPARLPTGRGRA